MLRLVRRFTNVAAMGAAAGGGVDPATTAWVAAVVAAGGTVSGTRQGIVDTFIKAVKTAGLWTTLDRFWLLGAENIHQALIDMVNLQSIAVTGTPTFTANVGVSNVTNVDYYDSNYIPSASSLFLTNSAVFGGQINNARTTASNNTANFGSADAGFTVIDLFAALTSALNASAIVNSTGGDSNANTSTKGLWTISRTGASTGEVYLNGASNFAITQSTSGGGRSSVSMLIGTFQQGAGGAFSGPGDTISSFFAGGGWNSTQAAAFYTAHNAMMTSIGIPVP